MYYGIIDLHNSENIVAILCQNRSVQNKYLKLISQLMEIASIITDSKWLPTESVL